MSYLALEVICTAEYIDIMMAELAEIGFATFQEKEDGTGLNAYAEENQQIELRHITEIFDRYNELTDLSYHISTVEKENWNEDWEKNYSPIMVDNRILVRADFHPADDTFPVEIIITPKMSFGTGHHETTYQMLDMMDKMEWSNKSVLDAGCGTGILAILAAIKGANVIEAFDIDAWAVENTLENFSLNSIGTERYNLWQGEVNSIPSKRNYDVILANINKNILLSDLSHYHNHLVVGGYILLSGFYEDDWKDLLMEANKYGLKEVKRSSRNKWMAVCLQKNE